MPQCLLQFLVSRIWNILDMQECLHIMSMCTVMRKIQRSIFLLYSPFPSNPHCTLCIISEQLIDIQGNVEALPGETVTEVTEIPETDIAKEEQVEIETVDATVPPVVPG